MPVNGYINNLTKFITLDSATEKGIASALDQVQSLLPDYFHDTANQAIAFGSYTRGTLLPRQIDHRAAADLMIVFQKQSHSIATYFDHIQLLAEAAFPNTRISRSQHALTVMVETMPLRIVPAIDDGVSTYRVPRANFDGWVLISPLESKKRIETADMYNGFLITPLIRLIKYWNAVQDYPFSSFQLETDVVNKGYLRSGGLFSSPKIFDYYFDFLTSQRMSTHEPPWKLSVAKRTNTHLKRAKRLMDGGRKRPALKCLSYVLPEVKGTPKTPPESG